MPKKCSKLMRSSPLGSKGRTSSPIISAKRPRNGDFSDSKSSIMIEDIEELLNNYSQGMLSYDADRLPIQFVRTSLLNWYSSNRRKLPWRGDLDFEKSENELTLETAEGKNERKLRVSAYGTWISEVMCQQTRVETVISYWNRWMESFPTVQSLALASQSEVSKHWAGLGYYRRANKLLLGAQKISQEFGNIPNDKATLLTVPGIGPYTAGAILSIAFNQVEPVVDGNVARVLSRLYAIHPDHLTHLALKAQHNFNITTVETTSSENDSDADHVIFESTSKSKSSTKSKRKPRGTSKATTSKPSQLTVDKLYWQIAADLVDPVEPGDFNQALMELGSQICKPTSPSCDRCSLRTVCRAFRIVQHSTQRTATSSTTSSSSITTVQQQPAFKFLPTDSALIANNASCNPLPIELAHLLPTQVTFFPVKTPKKTPREVSVAVCVLFSLDPALSIRRYLLLRRPSTGLLANQWEFPSITMENNQCNDKEEVGTAHTDGNNTAGMPAAFQRYLQEAVGFQWQKKESDDVSINNAVGNAPESKASVPAVTHIRYVQTYSCVEPVIKHIFSHERHRMTVSIVEVAISSSPTTSSSSTAPTESFKAYEWMTAAAMHESGITTGCKKILQAVEKSLATIPSQKLEERMKTSPSDCVIQDEMK